MKPFTFGGALSAGWRSFFARPWYLLGVVLLLVIIMAFTSGNAAATALAYMAFGGYLHLLLKHYRGETVVLDDLFSLDSRWISFAFLGVMKTLILIAGFILFIIPGIYLSVRYIFAEFLVLDEGLRPMEALRQSSQMTEGHWWKLFWFSFGMTILVILSIVAFVIGFFAMSVVATLALIHIYERIKQTAAATEPVVMEAEESHL
jgi:uncharacterized membrane protein